MAIIKKLIAGNEQAVVKKAVDIMKKGGVIVFPTESSYGLGTDATNETAIKKIASIKNQPEEKNISIIVANLEQAKQFGLITEPARKLVERFMPGPLTLVVEKRANVPNALAEKTIAFRISSNEIANALCEEMGNPITATSANLHNGPNIYSGREVIKQFNNRAHLIIDAGELPHNSPSTIYDVANERILRTGPIMEFRIKQALR